MATTKHNTQITVIDKDGHKYLLYPITKKECVEGLEEMDTHMTNIDTDLQAVINQMEAIEGQMDSISSHVEDTEGNPHKITAELIGAAPAGFGLGEENGKDCTDCNKATQIGFYSLRNAVNGPAGSTVFPNGVLLVEARDGAVCQTIRYENDRALRYYDPESGQWSPWEWVDPPMYTGVEYRTTERWAGAPVYTMLIEAGTLPKADRLAVEYPGGITPDRVLRVVGQISSGEPLPTQWDDSMATVYASRSYVYIETNDDAWSAYAAQVQVWYTK